MLQANNHRVTERPNQLERHIKLCPFQGKFLADAEEFHGDSPR